MRRAVLAKVKVEQCLISEVERARKLIQDSCVGYKIKSVDAKEDKIVYTGGTTHESFVSRMPRTLGCF